MPRGPSDMRAAIIRSLKDKTGRSIGQWGDLVRSKAPAGTRKERIAWLQREHALGHTQAAMIVDWVDRPEVFEDRDPAALVESMFKGKEPINPIYTRLASVIQELGDDVKVEPRQTYVAFSRAGGSSQSSSRRRRRRARCRPRVARTRRRRRASGRPARSDRVESHTASRLAHEDGSTRSSLGWCATPTTSPAELSDRVSQRARTAAG